MAFGHSQFERGVGGQINLLLGITLLVHLQRKNLPHTRVGRPLDTNKPQYKQWLRFYVGSFFKSIPSPLFLL